MIYGHLCQGRIIKDKNKQFVVCSGLKPYPALICKYCYPTFRLLPKDIKHQDCETIRVLVANARGKSDKEIEKKLGGFYPI